MLARLLVSPLRTLPIVASGAYLMTSTQRGHCGWFGGKSTAELEREVEEQRRREQVEALRSKLGPLASLDLNGDVSPATSICLEIRVTVQGKVDQNDFLLAMQLAKEKAMVDGGGDVVLKTIGDEASKLIATGVPSQLSWGFCSGYCAGFAAKKTGKFLAIFVGGVFCLLQALAYNGYIVVDQAKIEKDFNTLVDINQDNAVDVKDLQAIYDKVYEVLSYNMPSGSGFAAGMLLGLRTG